MQTAPALTLDRLPVGNSARVAAVDWDALVPEEARRLRELGLFEGVEVEALYRGSMLFRDPLAVRIGRMQFMMRAVHAHAIRLEAAPQS